MPAELAVGYAYATFDQDPNLVMLVGGDAGAFCLDNPEDPFNAEPGEALNRLFFRKSGVVDVKVNDKDQPISLYQLPKGAVLPAWLEEICEDVATIPDAFARGTADLKVRISDRGSVVDVFNSVNGMAQAADGTEYKVHASADLVVKNGVPQGDPADFVSLRLTEIRR